MPSVSARLCREDLDEYHANGYLVRPGIFNADEVADICAECEALVERIVRNRKARRQTFGSYTFDADMENGVVIKWEGDSDIVHGLEPFAHLSPSLKSWAYDPRFVEPMRDLIGCDNPELFTEKLNLKRPRHGGANPLHQDYPYWTRVAEDANEVYTAMLFLDESTLDNGCLHVAPGSHISGRWQGRADSDRFGANEIDESIYDDLELVPVEVPAGSVVMFGAMLVHQSAPNLSDRPRRALLYSYQPPGRRTQFEALTARTEISPD